MNETRKSRKGVAIGITFILLFLVAVGVTIGMAVSDPYEDTVQATAQPETVVPKLAKSLLTGEPALLTKEEVSGLLSSQVAGLHGGGFQVLDLQCVSVEDGAAEFYIRVSYSGLRLGVSARFTVGCDTEAETIWAELQTVHLGRLPIKAEWVLEIAKNLLPSEVKVEGKRLSVSDSFFDETVLGGAVGLKVQDLRVTPEGFQVQVQGNLERIQSHLGQYLEQFLATGD